VVLNRVDVLQRWQDKRPEIFTVLNLNDDVGVGAIMTPEVFAWWLDHYPALLDQNYQVLFDACFLSEACEDMQRHQIRSDWERFPIRQWVAAKPKLVEGYFAESRCHFVQFGIAFGDLWVFQWFAENYPHFDAILTGNGGELLDPVKIARTIANNHIHLKVLKWVQQWFPNVVDDVVAASTVNARTPVEHLMWIQHNFPHALALCAERVLPRYVYIITRHEQVLWWVRWATNGEEREKAIVAEISKTMSAKWWWSVITTPPPRRVDIREPYGECVVALGRAITAVFK
jgi:hypothetical protein